MDSPVSTRVFSHVRVEPFKRWEVRLTWGSYRRTNRFWEIIQVRLPTLSIYLSLIPPPNQYDGMFVLSPSTNSVPF